MLHPSNTPLGRFGVETLIDSPDPFVGAMPLAGLVNPVTGAPTVAPLAVLVDFVAVVNHYRRATDEWTVSSELSLELGPDALSVVAQSPDVPVLASARPCGPKGATSLGLCEITHRDVVIGSGTVRSVHIRLPGQFPVPPDQPAEDERPIELGDIMGLRVSGDAQSPEATLFQSEDPILNNSMGIVHGGIAAAGLELAASAALNAGRADQSLQTASMRVNYLRQFISGSESRYTATTLHAGRRSGLAEAQAIGADGQLALTARITAYA